MKKTLCQKARDIRGGVLESRIVARMDDLNRELTDAETIAELEYLRDTFQYSGYEDDSIREVLQAVKYLLRRYA